MTLVGSRFAAVRQRLGMSQSAFAKAIGVSVGMLHHWEQGRRNPSDAALSLLRLLEADPEAAIKVLADEPKPAATPTKRKARKGRKS
jgi:putative transcriptional regulator